MRIVYERIIAIFILTIMLFTAAFEYSAMSAYGTDGESKRSLNEPISSDEKVTWDCIYFGNYPQGTDGSIEPIKWRVLDINGTEAFLLADKMLDKAQFYPALGKITWKQSTLRRWLNGYGSGYADDNFIDTAFSQEEQEDILTKTIKTNNNNIYGYDGGEDTEDKVFVLSMEEASEPEYGFPNDYEYSETRICNNTEYIPNDPVWWWLRSSYGTAVAANIEYGGVSNYNYLGVRPAIYLDLSSDAWEYAGTVSSEGWRDNGEKTLPDTILENPTKDSTGNSVWECIYFGQYPQSSNGNGGFNNDKIKWRVLSVEGNEALVVSDKVLDSKKFNESYYRIRWEYSTVRSWLNGYDDSYNDEMIDYTSENFLDSAFTEDEQDSILVKTLKNKGDEYYRVEDGEDTADKVFLPTLEDVTNEDYGFSSDYNSDKNRYGTSTDYLKSIYASYTMIDPNFKDNSWWRLRSPGHYDNGYYAAAVSLDGHIDHDGWNHDNPSVCGIRPALYIDLSQGTWEYAGRTEVKKSEQEISVDSHFDKKYGCEPFSLGAVAQTKLSYESSDDSIVSVSDEGIATVKKTGTVNISIYAAGDSKYEPAEKKVTITVGKGDQVIGGSSSFSKTYGSSAFSLGATAKTKLTYKSSDTKVLTVSSTGKVTLKNPGTATITVTAAGSDLYNSATKKITVKSALKTPTITVKAYKKRRNKISWSKVYGASGYKVYVYDSSKKKYVCRLTKSSKVKSVTHKGLKKGKTYYYKVRAYKKVGSKIVYSEYSTVKKAKAKR